MKHIFLTLIFLGLITAGFTQTEKKPLDHSVYAGWKSINRSQLSYDGNWVSYEINPQKGDGWLYLYNTKTEKLDSVARGNGARFSPLSDYLVFKISPQQDSVRQMKLRKVKKDKLPTDSMGIWFLAGDSIVRYPNLKSFKVAEEETSWMVGQFENKEVKKTDKKEVKDTAEVKKELTEEEIKANKKTAEIEKKKQKKDAKQIKTYLLVLNPLAGKYFRFDKVDEYSISKNGELIAFKTLVKDSLDSSAVILFNTEKQKPLTLFETTGTVKKITIDNEGDQMSFLVSKDTTKNKVFTLYYWNESKKSASVIVDTLTKGMPAAWCVSENGNYYFSKDGKYLYFYTAPKPEKEVKDTLLEDEKFQLDIWKWDDPKIQSQQKKELSDELKRSYLAVYKTDKSTMFQVENETLNSSRVFLKGNSRYIIGLSESKYEISFTWESNRYYDASLIDIEKETVKPVFEKKQSMIALSPAQKYVIYYEATDSSFYTFNVVSGKISNLTKGIKSNFYREDTDVPELPDPYGIAGWFKNDEAVIIYDKYDFWKIDPAGKNAPLNFTKQYGRDQKLKLRYLNTDPDKEFFEPAETILISAFNEDSKEEGFYSFQLKSGILNKLIMNPKNYHFGSKAKNSEMILWTEEDFNQFPDLWISKSDFSNKKRITYANPQQKQYFWGTAESVSWKDEKGKIQKGLLYKPENFDASKKYPMIVYFYERYTDALYTHYTPRASASVINFPLYTSNGYLVFIPDIWYEKGHPGKSALETVVSGSKYLISKGFVDEKNVGLQGQSWGGYQTAYIITQTNMFKAAMAGAAVSNMISAYGGIRWESGVARMFQYEGGQSRIGVSLWDNPELYIENSPLFFADKVNTPLLMMNNDNDGAVPWQQGIEFYLALRRLQKPVWMLTYNNEEHNLKNFPNKVDLSIRMLQFFDHYLKNQTAPEWMKEGIPATMKGKSTGYKTEN